MLFDLFHKKDVIYSPAPPTDRKIKILVVGDVESRSLWDYYQPKKVEGVDFILSVGDLDPDYLSFLVTIVNKPVFYVHGNHDGKYERKPPEGCICVEDEIITYMGVRILGLGGSYHYSGGNHQYTEREMEKRIKKVMRKQIFQSKEFDILLTHAPAYDLNDGDDLPHQGFNCFRTLMEEYKPKYFIHGHVHMNYGTNYPRRMEYKETVVINGFEAYQFEY